MTNRDEHIYLADVLASDEKSTKTYTLQVGALPNEVIAQEVELVTPAGFVSRPAKADSSTACQAICSDMGNKSFCLATRETRNLPSVNEGEVMLYALGSDTNAQAQVYLKADGSIRVQTKQGNASGGQEVSLVVSPDSIKVTCGAFSASFDQNGATIGNGTAYVADSSKVDSLMNALVATLATGTTAAGAVTFGTPFTPQSVATTKLRSE